MPLIYLQRYVNPFVPLVTAGRLLTWGNNSTGQLGDGTTQGRSSPVQIGSLSWAAIAGGGFTGSPLYHTLALRSDGKLFAWGSNLLGQLGDGTTTDYSSPVQIGSSSWTVVTAGAMHSAAIRTDGILFAWGRNVFGALGQNDTTNQSSPVPVGSSSWTAVAAGGFHTLAVRTDGGLFTWGYNSQGQLGDPTITTATNRSSPVQIGLSSWTVVTASFEGSGAITSVRNLFMWGFGTSGEIGDNAAVNRSSPVQVNGGGSWSTVSAGLAVSLGLKTDGTLYSWGNNQNGNLAQNDGVARSSPTQIGTSLWTAVEAGNPGDATGAHALAIRVDGTLWAWGGGIFGQLGDNTTTTPGRSSPVQIGALTSWIRIDAGPYHSVAINTQPPSGGPLFAWGRGTTFGAVGDGFAVNRLSPVQIGLLSWTAISMGANSNHTLGIRSDGTLWAWGENTRGQLGLFDAAHRSSPVQVGASLWTAVATGGQHSLAITTDGALFTWGANLTGQLGDGTAVTPLTRSSPIQIGLSSWTTVSGGDAFSLGITIDNDLYAWGTNAQGQLGDLTVVNKSAPVQIGVAIWATVAAGARHGVAITNDGALFTWGDNGFGQLGDVTTVKKSSPVQIGLLSWTAIDGGDGHTVAIRIDRGLFAWGSNVQGQLGQGTDGAATSRSSPIQIGSSSWTTVSAGSVHNLAIRTDGGLFTWGGLGLFGEQGNGATVGRSSPTQIGSSSWTIVAASIANSVAIKV